MASKEQHIAWATFRLFFQVLAPGAARLFDNKVGACCTLHNNGTFFKWQSSAHGSRSTADH